MAADDDVLHFEVLDGVVDDGLGGDVRGGEDVGDVAVHEYLAWVEVEEGGFGGAGVGAAEPEDGGVLGFGEGGEEVGFCFGGAVGPGFVAFEVGVEAAFYVGRNLVSCERSIGSFCDVAIGLWAGALQ